MLTSQCPKAGEASSNNMKWSPSSITMPRGLCPIPTNPRTSSLNPQLGDRFTQWDHEMLWSERHKRPTQLEPLRRVGDPLADDCVAALSIKPGADALEILAQYLSRPTCQQESKAPRKFLEDALRTPNWVDWNTIKQGQKTYWAYASPIDFVLFHYSLIGGFASPEVVRTLQCTNYLASPSHTFHRLMETFQFVVDCMKDGIQTLKPGSGKGWASVVRVRLLHSQVRLRILNLAAAHGAYYSVEEYGVPINQEDTIATLCAFSISIIVALEQKMGINLSPKDVSAYLHLWRLIGHYLGVLPENNPLTSREDALGCFESVFCHLVYPNETSAAMARSILQAVVEKPPFRQSFAFHSAMVRALLGQKLSDALRIEPSSWYHRAMVVQLFATFRWTSSPRWFLSRRKRMAKKNTSQLLETIAASGMELNFTMKMVPQISEKDGH